jgi:ribonuclease T1
VTTVAAAGGRPTPTPTPRGQPTEAAANDGLPQIEFGRLPPQAQETIRLIERGGPFPYDRDGVTFGNRERLLPIRADGYYREYTVITPGSPDRGARRIVAGREGELYYTDDHYESFRRVRR